jgi:hypothetical protein
MTLPVLPGGYTWDASIKRYRDTRGRIVSRQTIRASIDAALDKMDLRARELALQLRAGEISLAQWELDMRVLVKDAHLFSAAAVRGGFDRMGAGDFGRVGQLVRTQYGYLDRFAGQIANGQQPLNGYMVNRATLYTQQARVTHEAFLQSDQRREAKRRGGRLEARNVLGDADHCDQCEALTRRGWIPEKEMPLPGTRTCRGRCHCRVERRVVGGEPADD